MPPRGHTRGSAPEALPVPEALTGFAASFVTSLFLFAWVSYLSLCTPFFACETGRFQQKKFFSKNAVNFWKVTEYMVSCQAGKYKTYRKKIDKKSRITKGSGRIWTIHSPQPLRPAPRHKRFSGQDIELKPDAPFSWEHKKMPAAVRQAFLCVCGNQSSG